MTTSTATSAARRRARYAVSPDLLRSDVASPGLVEVPRPEVRVLVLRVERHRDLLIPDRDVRRVGRAELERGRDRRRTHGLARRVVLAVDQRVHRRALVVRRVER